MIFVMYMKTTLSLAIVPGTQSDYRITLHLTADDKSKMREDVLREYQKDATKPWFRKGHVPLNMVEQMLNPGSIMMASVEEFVNTAISKAIAEYPDYHFIGQPYALDMSQYESDKPSLSFTLDVYPALAEKDKKWQKVKKDAYKSELTQKEIDATVDQLRSSYAQFDDAAEVAEDVLTRVKLSFLKGKEVLGNPKNQYLGREEVEVNKDLKKAILGKKIGDSFEIDYKKVADINGMTYTGEGDKPTIVLVEIIDTKKKVLPDLNQEFIDKIFTKEDNIDSVDTLMSKIKETLLANKEKNSLFEWINDYLTQVDSSFDLIVPKTLVDEEMKNRLEHLSKQLWGDKGLQNYLQKMGDEKSKSYLEEIKQAGITSMRKFFIIKFIGESLKLDIDWTKNQDDGEIEKKLYDKLVA